MKKVRVRRSDVFQGERRFEFAQVSTAIHLNRRVAFSKRCF